MGRFICETCGHKFVEDSQNIFCPECNSEVFYIPADEVQRVFDSLYKDKKAITHSSGVAELFKINGYTVLSDNINNKYIIRKKEY